MADTMWTQRLNTILTYLAACALALTMFLAIPVFSFLSSYRMFVLGVAKAFRRDLDKFIPDLGTVLACDTLEDPKYTMVTRWILDKPLDLEHLRRLVQDRLLAKKNPENSDKFYYPELRQHRASFMGYFFWKWDEDFKVEDHVKDFEFGPTQGLKADDMPGLMSHLLSQPWSLDSSPWEFLQIRNFYPDEKSEPKALLVFRNHHVLLDGRGLFQLIYQDLCQGGDQSFPLMKYERKPWWKKLLKVVQVPFLAPLMLAKIHFDTLNVPKHWRGLATRKKKEQFVGITAPFSTKVIKELKDKYKTDYNIAMFAVVARALQRLVSLSCDSSKDNGVRNLSCGFPVGTPNHPDGLVNNAGLNFIQLPIDTLDMQDCIRKLADQAKEANATGVGITASLTQNLLVLFPHQMLNIMLRIARSPPVFVTTVPGPMKTIKLDGVTMDDPLGAMSLFRKEVGQ